MEESMKYCLSKFTRMINADNGDIIIFNTFTGKQNYIFDETIKSQIQMLLSLPQEENLIDSRIISGFCVPEGTNENLLVYNTVNDYINSTNSLSLILFPTLNCNFSCSYCYEKKEKGEMQDSTYDKLFLAIKKHHEENRLDFLKLEWFGGEPLLCYEKLIEFTKRVNRFCEDEGIAYQHSMTTNGYLLSVERVIQLMELKIQTYQITIDGAAKTHNVYRPLRGGKPSWNKIIANLLDMKKMELDFSVLIRINYNYEVLDSIEEFLDFFKDNFGDDCRFNLAFKPIGHWGGENDDAVNIVPYDYHSFVLDELLKICKNKGILSTINLSFSCGSELCYANKKNSYVIYKNGAIGKCTLEESPDESSAFVVGSIDEGYFNIYKEKEEKWLIADSEKYITYLETNGCFDCIAYPFCCGTTCPAHRVQNGLGGKAKCSPTKDNINHMILLNYESQKRGG